MTMKKKVAAELDYYYLKLGDYVQLGDEYEFDGKWNQVSRGHIGWKWGYHPDTGERYDWYRVRRLMPNEKVDMSCSIQEQWGLEFEV